MATQEETPRCAKCGAALEWLGSHTQRVKDSPAVKVVHWVCECGRRWVHHSERGWRETKVDLTAD